ncbi:MAG: hypothetical protein QOH26_1936, partial [Actinomycetota bacterium]|nr:hypothetical protein [Actinomycetota bacterium]
MFRNALRVSVILGILVCALPGPARAAGACARTVIVTMPGVIWSDIDREKPPNILEAAGHGATGSISVRTDSSVTSYGDGFLTLGAGTRTEASDVRAATERVEHLGSGPISFAYETQVAQFDELTRSAASSSYEPQLGALATALAARDDIAVFAIGNADLGMVEEGGEQGRWPLFVAMNENGVVERSVVDQSLLAPDAAAPFGVRTDPERIRRAVGEALDDPCSMIVIDGGDLIRREEAIVRSVPSAALREPLLALDALVGAVRSRLDPARDLLLLVSPTSPLTDALPHLGVAIAEGPGFGAGDALTSGSTGASGIVALTDVA